MGECQVVQRKRAEQVLDELVACESVVDGTRLPPGAGPADRWVVDVILDEEGVPAQVLAVASEHSLSLRYAQPQGPFWSALFVV